MLESRIGLFGLPWTHTAANVLAQGRYRFVIRRFKEGQQVGKEEFVRLSHRPDDPGEVDVTFYRRGVEDFDSAWIGIYSPHIRLGEDGPNLLGEWDISGVKILSVTPLDEDGELVKISYTESRRTDAASS